MKNWSERAVFVSMAPLALALAAFGVREATRETTPVELPVTRAKEIALPPLLLMAAAAKGEDVDLSVDPNASRARCVSSAADDSRCASARVTGTMRLLADGTIEALELALESHEDQVAPELSGLVLHGTTSSSRTTPVPGVHASEMVCTVDRGEHRGMQAVLDVEWMRTPGGALHMHAVGTLADPAFEPTWTDRVHFRPASRVIGLDLRFIQAE